MNMSDNVAKTPYVHVIKPVKLTTTFALLRKAGACEAGYRKLAKYLGGINSYGKDKEINLLTILESNGFDDAVWCFRATVQDADSVKRHIAADFAESVLHIYESKYPGDNRPRNAVEVAHKFADGEASEDERIAARKAAADAADAAYAAYAAADAAAYAAADAAAYAAANAANAAARKEKKQQLAEIVKRYLLAD